MEGHPMLNRFAADRRAAKARALAARIDEGDDSATGELIAEHEAAARLYEAAGLERPAFLHREWAASVRKAIARGDG